MNDLYYKQKYLKYKFKYLDLKKEYEGGAFLLTGLVKSAAKAVAAKGSEVLINQAEKLCIETADKVLAKSKKTYEEAKLHCNKEQKCIDGAAKLLTGATDLHTKIIGNTDDKSCKKIAAKAREEAKKALTKVK